MPYQPFWKIAKMHFFTHAWNLNFFGQIISFEVAKNLFIKCLWLRPSAFSSAISKIICILGSYKFLVYLECIRSYTSLVFWPFRSRSKQCGTVVGPQILSSLELGNHLWYYLCILILYVLSLSKCISYCKIW